MRKFIVFATILLIAAAAADSVSQTSGKRVVMLPFYDESGYRGPWDIRYEVPEMIGDMLGGADDYFFVVPMDSVKAAVVKPEKPSPLKRFINLFRSAKRPQRILTDSEILSVARGFDADIAITGVIKTFNYRRWGGVEPMVGGYKSFTATVDIEQVRIIRVSDGRPLGTISGKDVKNTRGLGLELFGKPRQMDLEFLSLDSLDFGSKRYLGTLMGLATIEALNQVHKEIRSIIARPDSSWYLTKNFKVVSIDMGNVIIDAGTVDGIKPGDKFNVFASESGVRVGKINVIQVWSDHLSRAEIIDGRDEIRPEDKIMPEM